MKNKNPNWFSGNKLFLCASYKCDFQMNTNKSTPGGWCDMANWLVMGFSDVLPVTFKYCHSQVMASQLQVCLSMILESFFFLKKK